MAEPISLLRLAKRIEAVEAERAALSERLTEVERLVRRLVMDPEEPRKEARGRG